MPLTDDYEIERLTRKIVPPVGMRTIYQPGAEGFLEKDLTATPNAPRKTAVPESDQARLEDLERMNPTPITGMPTYGGGMSTMTFGNREYTMPTGAMNEAIAGVPPNTEIGSPKYTIPDEWTQRFDQAIRGITETSPEIETLRRQARGFDLPPGQSYGRQRYAAQRALVDIETNRRNAIASLAHNLTNLMVEPSKFARDIYGKQLEYGLGRERLGLENERLRLLGRRAAIEELELPWKMETEARKPTETVTGIGEGGERILYNWNPETKQYGVMTRGALPIETTREGKIVDPATGKILYQGEGGKFNEELGKLAYKSFLDEIKQISGEIKPDEEKTSAMLNARKRLSETLTQLGLKDVLPSQAIPTGSSKVPNLDEFRRVVKQKYPQASDEDILFEYQRAYGGR
jgi:hypothetical protein